MEKFVQRTYAVAVLALAALLIYYCFAYRVKVDSTLPKMGCEQLQVREDENGLWTGEFTVQGITGKYCHLIFYTIHQKYPFRHVL